MSYSHGISSVPSETTQQSSLHQKQKYISKAHKGNDRIQETIKKSESPIKALLKIQSTKELYPAYQNITVINEPNNPRPLSALKARTLFGTTKQNMHTKYKWKATRRLSEA